MRPVRCAGSEIGENGRQFQLSGCFEKELGMLLTFLFFVVLLAAGLAWEAWSFYTAPIVEERERRREKKHDAA